MKLHAGHASLLGGLLVLTLGAASAAAPREAPKLVVGTFDSRGVLFAYVRSGEFQDYVAAQKEDIGHAIDRAKAAGDEELVDQLEAVGPAMQARIHRQGFGNAPVDDILARIADRLPAIAEEAGVDVIVSKWKLAYRKPSAQTVDVTERLAQEFHPDEATLQSIREIMKQDPVPLDQLTDHD